MEAITTKGILGEREFYPDRSESYINLYMCSNSQSCTYKKSSFYFNLQVKHISKGIPGTLNSYNKAVTCLVYWRNSEEVNIEKVEWVSERTGEKVRDTTGDQILEGFYAIIRTLAFGWNGSCWRVLSKSDMRWFHVFKCSLISVLKTDWWQRWGRQKRGSQEAVSVTQIKMMVAQSEVLVTGAEGNKVQVYFESRP